MSQCKKGSTSMNCPSGNYRSFPSLHFKCFYSPWQDLPAWQCVMWLRTFFIVRQWGRAQALTSPLACSRRWHLCAWSSRTSCCWISLRFSGSAVGPAEGTATPPPPASGSIAACCWGGCCWSCCTDETGRQMSKLWLVISNSTVWLRNGAKKEIIYL